MVESISESKKRRVQLKYVQLSVIAEIAIHVKLLNGLSLFFVSYLNFALNFRASLWSHMYKDSFIVSEITNWISQEWISGIYKYQIFLSKVQT